MESSDRVNLAQTSGKNKKLNEILEHSENFQGLFDKKVSGLEPSRPFLPPDEAGQDLIEGRDISVCVRIRPMLEHETKMQFFQTCQAKNPKILSMEPRMDVRKHPRPNFTEYDVDFAFGPSDDNESVYSSVTMPLIDLGLKGGVCTMLAYGQTGSGKTHTIGGILERIGKDLFERQRKNGLAIDENGDSYIKLFLSFFELLGNDATDLLSEDRKPVDILEDQFGKINTRNATEVEITSPDQFLRLVQAALSQRRTETTFKNDTSSRSHAICSLRVQNTLLKEAEDGKIFVIDLAGSENAADAQFHNRSLVKETQLINKSLMSLKDCIRNRALSALNPDKYYHIPYRQSRLTLLLKDAFELESHRHCKTVVIACVSPSCSDVSMTMNTLRYVTPIKVGQANREKVKVNPDNPANWTNETLSNWVNKTTKGKIRAEILCPFESGMQLLRIPETEFIQRVLESNPDFGEKRAKLFYTSLWKLLIDARTAERKEKLKYKGKSVKQKDAEYRKELMERLATMTEVERTSIQHSSGVAAALVRLRNKENEENQKAN